MTDAVRLIADQVRSRVRRDGVDLSSPEVAGDYVDAELRRYSERALSGSFPMLPDERRAGREVLAALTGYGPLQEYLDDPEVEEIWINGPSRVFIARDGVPELTSTQLTEVEVRDVVERMLQSSGRRVDLSSPFVDASLPDGSRLHVVIPDITQRHWAVNIRKFGRRIRELGQLVALGSLTQQAAEFLRMCVLSGQNILVSGSTQAGEDDAPQRAAVVHASARAHRDGRGDLRARRRGAGPRGDAVPSAESRKHGARSLCAASSRSRCGCGPIASWSERCARRRVSTS